MAQLESSKGKMYQQEKKYADWEREKIQKARSTSPLDSIKELKPVAEELMSFLRNPIDQECCLALQPQLDMFYRGGREVALVLQLQEDLITLNDVIRFIHAIVVGHFLKTKTFQQKPFCVIVNGITKEKSTYQRIFEVIDVSREIGAVRGGCSILRTMGMSKKNVVDILVQPLNVDGKKLNTDNFLHQLAVLSNGRACSLDIARDLIEGDIFISLSGSVDSGVLDASEIKRIVSGIIILILFIFFAIIMFST